MTWSGCPLLLTSPDELHDNRAFLDAVTYEVIAEIDVFAAAVKHWILAKGNRRLVVDEDERRGGVLIQHLAEKASKPNALTGCCSCRDVLRLARRYGDNLLPHRLPADGTIPEKE